jgi:histidyl-tRNA synthetase
VLVDYYSGHIGKLSEDSKSRLQRNPLRILDSKDDADKSINATRRRSPTISTRPAATSSRR